MSDLTVPEVTDETSTLTAALAYAAAGFYVLPINPKTRIPLLKEWQRKSSRDRDQICEWFIGTDSALAIHAGRSGIVVFDVDRPQVLPEALAAGIAELAPPFHATRDDNEGRGHYLFRVPAGRVLGNGRGAFYDAGTEAGERQRTWGEVRGLNGFIIVAPSPHAKGGHYHWVRIGAVPVLPAAMSALLPDGHDAADVATDETVAAFMARHILNLRPRNLDAICDTFVADAKAGSRHEALIHCAAWAMREAQDGWFPATEARDRLQGLFVASMAGEDRPVLSEYFGALAWAVGQALITPSVISRAASSNPVADPADVAAARVIDLRERAQAAADSEQHEEPGHPPVLTMAPEDPDAFDSPPIDGPGPVVAGDRYAGADPRAIDGYFGEVGEPLQDDIRKAYFPVKGEGIDVAVLAEDVLRLGPLAWGRDNHWWAYREGVWRCTPAAIEGRCVRLLGGLYRPSYDSAAHNVVRHHRDIPQLNFLPVESIMNFTNGLLDWRTGERLEHDPLVRTTIQFPFAYDPDATCPNFDAFLESILEPETVDLLWEIIGYLMYSGNPLQVAIMLYGAGGNGKGTVLRVIQQILGEENCSAISLDDLNGDRFAPAGLFGKIANLAGDIDSTFQESTAAFKSLTGEDTFRGQQKYGQPFTFESYAVPVFSANKIPGSADTSEGYLRRWIVVPFNTHVPAEKQILGLSRKLGEEVPGIAAHAVRALRALMERGVFQRVGAVATAFDAFAEDIDRVRQWVDQCSVPAATNREPQTVVYKSFVAWAHENGSKPMAAKELHERLAAIGYPTKKVQGTRQTVGLQVVKHRIDSERGLTLVQRSLDGDEDEADAAGGAL